MRTTLTQYRQEMADEMDAILDFWRTHAPDQTYGGFIGRIDHHQMKDHTAPKGIVLNARILWTFSTAYAYNHIPSDLVLAQRAYEYIIQFFEDKLNGGYYWMLDHTGLLLQSKKQSYAQAFVIYAFVAYYHITQQPEVLEKAIAVFRLMEKYSYDPVYKGYIEAVSDTWQPIEDVRLSDKDANATKTMNTHLHILEAYTSLYEVWPNEALQRSLHTQVQLFLDYFIDSVTHHLILFFNDQWKPEETILSFGHEIETVWLLRKAAKALGNETLIQTINARMPLLADASLKGWDELQGGLWYEQDESTGIMIREKHWWPQAEAMVGYLDIWQLTGRQHYLNYSIATWQFVKQYIKDAVGGEWIWGLIYDASSEGKMLHHVMTHEDKAGFWKCPYHNYRACFEVYHRLKLIMES